MKLWLDEWQRSQNIQFHQYREGDAALKPACRHWSMKVQYLVLLSVGLFLISATLMAQEVKVTSLVSQVMTDVSGKEGLMITVEYPPAGSDPIHRHNAHAFLAEYRSLS